MSEESESLIGFDPLAWMREEDESEGGGSDPAVSSAPEKKSAPAVQAAAVSTESLNGSDSNRVDDPMPESDGKRDSMVDDNQPATATTAGDGAKDGGEILLPAVCDISLVSRLYDQLLRHASDNHGLVINGSEVERIDASTLQLLAVWAHDHQRDGQSIQWTTPSGPLIEAARLLDLDRLLGLAA
jgi:anti-anti-sigma regulatory factor